MTAPVLTDLDFADDICLLSREMEQAQQLLRLVKTECKNVGLELNNRNSEVMAINIPVHDLSTNIKGEKLAEVSKFK